MHGIHLDSSRESSCLAKVLAGSACSSATANRRFLLTRVACTIEHLTKKLGDGTLEGRQDAIKPHRKVCIVESGKRVG